MNVLIIDDEPDILEILSEEFKHNGYAVTSASSGDEAIGILKNIKFDIVLSDYKMPNGNGMKVLEFINSLSDKPVFYFCSASCGRFDGVQALLSVGTGSDHGSGKARGGRQVRLQTLWLSG